MDKGNLDFAEWPTVFGDTKMTTTLPDRPMRHCYVVKTGTESIRFRRSGTLDGKRVVARGAKCSTVREGAGA